MGCCGDNNLKVKEDVNDLKNEENNNGNVEIINIKTVKKESDEFKLLNQESTNQFHNNNNNENYAKIETQKSKYSNNEFKLLKTVEE